MKTLGAHALEPVLKRHAGPAGYNRGREDEASCATSEHEDRERPASDSEEPDVNNSQRQAHAYRVFARLQAPAELYADEAAGNAVDYEQSRLPEITGARQRVIEAGGCAEGAHLHQRRANHENHRHRGGDKKRTQDEEAFSDGGEAGYIPTPPPDPIKLAAASIGNRTTYRSHRLGLRRIASQ